MAPPQLVYGRHVVALLLERRPHDVRALWALKPEPGGTGQAALVAQARAAGLPCSLVARGELDRLAEGGVHQGVVAAVAPFAYAPFAALLAAPLVPLVLVLDQLQDPRNVGALVRSAAAFGASGVLMTQDRSAPMTASALKASAGAAYLLPIVAAKNLRRALDALGEAGVWRHGLAAEASQVVRQVDWRLPSAVVVGHEGSGLRRLTRQACDTLAAVPAGGMESLNAAVAGSVALYEAAAQRA